MHGNHDKLPLPASTGCGQWKTAGYKLQIIAIHAYDKIDPTTRNQYITWLVITLYRFEKVSK